MYKGRFFLLNYQEAVINVNTYLVSNHLVSDYLHYAGGFN